MIVFDIETKKHIKFDGGPASLQAEISELKTKKKNQAKSGFKQGPSTTLESLAEAASVIKHRIACCSVVSMSNKPEMDVWMALRKKAVVEMPEARAHHGGVVYGAGLIVHGGLSGEGNKTLSDWNLFDFGLQVWINCIVDESFSDERQEPFVLARKYHTLTAAIEPNLTNGRELTRLMWTSPLQELIRKPSITE